MEDNKRRTIKKRIQEVQVGHRIPGTDIIAREYWDYILNDGRNHGGDSDFPEDPFANPDVLDSEQSPYRRPLSEVGELMMRAVRETMAELTPKQRSVIQLMRDGVWFERPKTAEELKAEVESKTEEYDDDGNRVLTVGELAYSEQAVADALRVSRTTVQDALTRIKTKIRRRYEKLKAVED